jgi:hypothetical protein
VHANVHFKEAEREFFSFFFRIRAKLHSGKTARFTHRLHEKMSEWKRARRRTLIKKRNAISCIFVLLQAAAAREYMRLGRRRGARDEGVAYPACRRGGPLFLSKALAGRHCRAKCTCTHATMPRLSLRALLCVRWQLISAHAAKHLSAPRATMPFANIPYMILSS